MISQDQVIKASSDFMKRSPLKVSHHPFKISGHSDCGMADIMWSSKITWSKFHATVRTRAHQGKLSGITKPCTHLQPAPSASTQPHPAPSTSIQLISTSNQLHPPPHSSFQHPPSSLQYPQQYLNQILHVIRQFPQILAEKLKAVHFD